VSRWQSHCWTLVFFLKYVQDQDFCQFKLNPERNTEEQIEKIKERLLELHPYQHAIQLSAISRLLEGSGTVIDLKLPKGPIKGRGRPKGAQNKPKSTTRDPSSFEILDKKRKKEDKEEDQKKKKKAKLEEEEQKKKKKAKLEEEEQKKKKNKVEEEVSKKKF